MQSCYNMHMASRGIAYELWAHIESERFVRRWTAVRMAEHIGLPRGTIARLKEGARPPTAATVHKIADALDIDLTEAGRLAGLKIGTPGPPEPPPDDLEDDIKTILEERDLPLAERYRLARVLIAEYDRQRERERERSREHLQAVAEAWLNARSA